MRQLLLILKFNRKNYFYMLTLKTVEGKNIFPPSLANFTDMEVSVHVQICASLPSGISWRMVNWKKHRGSLMSSAGSHSDLLCADELFASLL